ncbi:hypothetical protein GCM10009820_22120 [Leifsonia soli]
MGNQQGIDDAILAFYSEVFDENARLTSRSAQGCLQSERAQEFMRAGTRRQRRFLTLAGQPVSTQQQAPSSPAWARV